MRTASTARWFPTILSTRRKVNVGILKEETIRALQAYFAGHAKG